MALAACATCDHSPRRQRPRCWAGEWECRAASQDFFRFAPPFRTGAGSVRDSVVGPTFWPKAQMVGTGFVSNALYCLGYIRRPVARNHSPCGGLFVRGGQGAGGRLD
jgi:hypothetical protein